MSPLTPFSPAVPVAQRIKAAMDAKGWTQAKLADEAGYDERTIRNVLSGQSVRRRTLVHVCQAVGVDLRSDADNEVAAEIYGGYARRAVDEYIGRYLVVRRSFSVPGNLVGSLFAIEWDFALSRLAFWETQKLVSGKGRPVDHSQGGGLYISPTTGMVHFLTIIKGALRLVTVTRLRQQDQSMRGAVLTQAEHTMYYQPSASPIFFRKLPDEEAGTEAPPLPPLPLGAITPGHADYRALEAELAEVETEIVCFARGLPPAAIPAAMPPAAGPPPGSGGGTG